MTGRGCSIMTWRRYLTSLARKKSEDEVTEDGPKLARVLNLLDLTGLGVGSTLGLGVYVLAGAVAREQAGPAVVISFLIAAIASAFAGLCYAEFAARVPKAGSAYVYSYVTIGELVAFIIGWNLILEYVIGTASIARGLSGYIDTLGNYTLSNALMEAIPIDVSFLSSYPDFLSFAVVLIITGLLAFGVKESTLLNNLFTGINICVITTIIVTGSINADVANWNIPKEDVANIDGAGEGGFMPFGIAGIMAGAAKCFFGFVGFDGIATTGEEAKNPKRDIPLAIVISLAIVFVAYFGIATVLTMMLPYYNQNVDAPFPHAFDEINWITIKWVVTIGAIFALCTSLLGVMFPLPRIVYAMGKDGLIFKRLSGINARTKTPVLATLLSGVFAGLMALIFELQQLIDMMSIGTLLAYSIVALSVLLLHFEDPSEGMAKADREDFIFYKRLLNWYRFKKPTVETAALSRWIVVVFIIFEIIVCAMVAFVPNEIANLKPLETSLLVIFISFTAFTLLILSLQPKTTVKLSFKVPLVPIIPSLSVIMNTYLMFQLDKETWIRFVVWLAVGFLLYFWYGNSHSVENQGKKIGDPVPEDNGTVPVIITISSKVKNTVKQ